MRIMLVYWAFEDQGSGLLINGYARAASEMGHEVVVYGRPIPNIPLDYSMDVESADARLTIPMQEPVESLNAAVTADLVVYEAGRQRARSASSPPLRGDLHGEALQRR